MMCSCPGERSKERERYATASPPPQKVINPLISTGLPPKKKMSPEQRFRQHLSIYPQISPNSLLHHDIYDTLDDMMFFTSSSSRNNKKRRNGGPTNDDERTGEDILAEAYFSRCVEAEPQPDYVIEYPQRVYHVKPPIYEGWPRSREIPIVTTTLAEWQRYFLWQPVVPAPLVATNPTEEEEVEERTKRWINGQPRRPVQESDQLNLAQFLWFRPQHDDTRKKTPALGFRPFADVLFFDTCFLETYLSRATPAMLDDPLNSSFFAFLPREESERAKIKMVYLSTEPLRKPKALFSVSEERSRSGGGVGGRQRQTGKEKEEEEEAYNLRIRRRTVARLLVKLFPDLRRVFLVEMASVTPRRVSNGLGGFLRTTIDKGDDDDDVVVTAFARWTTLEAAISEEHRQLQQRQCQKQTTTNTTAYKYFRPRGNPETQPLYHHAIQRGLLSPIWDDVSPGVSFSRGSPTAPTLQQRLDTHHHYYHDSLPGLLEKELYLAKKEIPRSKQWHAEVETLRLEPELKDKRYRKHRREGYWTRRECGKGRSWRGWKDTDEADWFESQEERDLQKGVKAFVMIMLYDEGRVERAREMGWEPGEMVDLGHLEGK